MQRTDLITSDFKSLEIYFHKLFQFHGETLKEEKALPIVVHDNNSGVSANSHGISQYIKPGMVIDIYCFVDFSLREICKDQKARNTIDKSFGDLKARNELSRFNKYLTTCAGLNLSEVKKSYDRLHELRNIRNKLIHEGGHIEGDDKDNFSKIKGIEVHCSLIVITDDFIREQLEHAKKYLLAAAK
ncbi:MAG: hypothetical protein COB46_03810 [Rhodospirillaceae bacterium]|nr:MAG: hypothetical protein COB46_03810 [Rhodospirillaceae bacterium]